MFEADKPVHIRELYWLANFYEMHGNEEKAKEILATIAQHRLSPAKNGSCEIVDIFPPEKKEA